MTVAAWNVQGLRNLRRNSTMSSKNKRYCSYYNENQKEVERYKRLNRLSHDIQWAIRDNKIVLQSSGNNL